MKAVSFTSVWLPVKRRRLVITGSLSNGNHSSARHSRKLKETPTVCFHLVTFLIAIGRYAAHLSHGAETSAALVGHINPSSEDYSRCSARILRVLERVTQTGRSQK